MAAQECNFRDTPALGELAERSGIDCISFNIMRTQGTYSAEEHRRRAVIFFGLEPHVRQANTA